MSPRQKSIVINKDNYIQNFSWIARKRVILGLLFIIGHGFLFAQTDDSTAVITGDTLSISADSSQAQSDTTKVVKDEGSVINSKIDYSARDSIDNDVVNKKVYLYGDAVVNYEDITLKAAVIIYDFTNYTVSAFSREDTLGNIIGMPLFQQGDSEFEAMEMDYNFRSKKAYVKQVETAVIEGTLTGQTVKTTQDNSVIYVRNGEYCPCEDPNAKTRFKIGKLKVIQDDKIVSGPGYLALGKVPTPLVFPFGFFPNAEQKQAGLIVPSYGNADQQGFFLNDLGFYLPVGDNLDTKMLFDIYSRGSYGIENITRYKKRYKYDGSFGIEYNVRVDGDREIGNFSENKSFFVNWRHAQDRKAKPNSNFSAEVNAGSTNNFQNNLLAGQNDYLTNTFRSNIRYNKSFYDSPWTLALNAGHNQNSRTGNFDITLPQLAANMARIFPLKGLSKTGPDKWYEKIGVNYSGDFRNTLSVQEDELSLENWSELRRQFRNGIQHNTSASTSFKAGPVSINPSFSYAERWYFKTAGRRFDPNTQQFEVDTINGFDRNWDWNFSTSLTTKVYGMYSFRGGKVQAIRHTFTPTLSYSYRPDFDPRVYGFYGADGTLGSYSPYEDGIYGGPPSGENNLLRLSLVNNIEAKVLSRRDTTSRYKKIPLMENITLSGSYNMAADSLKMSFLSLSGRTKITEYANINFNGSFDPYNYAVNSNGAIRRVDVFLWDRERRLASFENGTVAINSRGFGSSAFKKKSKEPELVQEGEETESSSPVIERKKSFFKAVPPTWNVSFGYSVYARRVRFSEQQDEGFAIDDSLNVTQSIQFNGDIDLFGRLRISMNSGYDFVMKEFTPTTILVAVDLNCWELNARVVPFGFRKSYSISLNIKSSMLRDLKLERNRPIGQDENGNFFF